MLLLMRIFPSDVYHVGTTVSYPLMCKLL